MLRTGRLLLLAAGAWAIAPGGGVIQPALAQAGKPAAKKETVFYDQYEPLRARRGRAESCMRDEDEIGAYCVKFCRPGYVMVADSNPPRCRSREPLPPGQLPGPLHRDAVEAQPKLPGQGKPRSPSGGA